MKIEILKRKRPAALIVFFFALLGTLAIWLLVRFVYPNLPGFWDLKTTAAAAIAGAVMVGSFFVIKQSRRNAPGLIIDENGITDHSNAASIGFIRWSDIAGFKEAKGDFHRTVIVVMVKYPEVYINKPTGVRVSRQMQYQQFGSPILIIPASLEYPEVQLMNLLQDWLAKKTRI